MVPLHDVPRCRKRCNICKGRSSAPAPLVLAAANSEASVGACCRCGQIATDSGSLAARGRTPRISEAALTFEFGRRLLIADFGANAIDPRIGASGSRRKPAVATKAEERAGECGFRGHQSACCAACHKGLSGTSCPRRLGRASEESQNALHGLTQMPGSPYSASTARKKFAALCVGACPTRNRVFN